jgi:DNA repair exonuclease SbcCD nuclease subunit
MLVRDLSGRPLGAPVIYPGSVERTAFAEREEEKGYALCEFLPSGDGSGSLLASEFVPLPTRPMVSLVLQADAHTAEGLTIELRRRLAKLHPEAVVRVQVQGTLLPEAQRALSASKLRAMTPASMNVTVSYPSDVRSARARQRTAPR